ncbi:peptide-N-glycosidase F-related protein [Flavobacteriales bacterium]|nr:peptide-N-glycosidase F-related protein [Flavobacteriales bacterium]
MKKNNSQNKLNIILFILLTVIACSKSDSADNDNVIDNQSPTLNIDKSLIQFDNTMISKSSEAATFSVQSQNLNSEISLSVGDNFEISEDNSDFKKSLTVQPNQNKTLYVRFSPAELGTQTGLITITSSNVSQKTINLSGIAIKLSHNYKTYIKEHLAFGSGLSQSSVKSFDLHDDMENIESIKMYVQLECPNAGCNAWDVFANILVKEPASNEWLEIGRYITPYGVDTSVLERGIEIDVTDFKSLLSGTVELKAYIEVWGSDGWNLSVDFDYTEGEPDYKYYQISRVIQYNKNSLEGVIYGEDQSEFDLNKTISFGENIQSAYLRTIITGWGHATPADSDGRRCAEWCFRTHDIKINDANRFQHEMKGIGCSANPINNQAGNWSPDRAGWCPGMAVPLRLDNFDENLNGKTLKFEYAFQPWVNDLQTTANNKHAYYAISTFIVLKSNEEISPAVVTN